MRDQSWLAALDHELAARGVGPSDRAEALVEVEGFLVDAGLRAIDQFGPPAAYAEKLASAVGAMRGREPRPPGPPVVEARRICKAFRARPVLADFSIAVAAGDVVALVGANGAGKTTLLRILAGLERPDSGHARCHGSVGYVPQAGGLDPYLSPVEHFELFGTARGLGRSAARIEGERLARELGWDAGSAPTVGRLSGGTRQKLSVIVALIGSPDVALLDEPYQGMDADGSQRFWELLWELCGAGMAAVVSSHNSDVLSHARSVVELAEVSRGPG